MPFRFRKHERHNLPYDVNNYDVSAEVIKKVHFCTTMFVDMSNTTVPNLIYV